MGDVFIKRHNGEVQVQVDRSQENMKFSRGAFTFLLFA